MRGFPELMDQLIDLLIALVDFFEAAGPRDYNFTRNEYQKGHFRMFQTINQPWEKFRHELYLGLLRFLRYVVQLHLFQMDRELGVGRSHHVLNLKLRVFNGETHLLDDSGILTTGQLALLL